MIGLGCIFCGSDLRQNTALFDALTRIDYRAEIRKGNMLQACCCVRCSCDQLSW